MGRGPNSQPPGLVRLAPPPPGLAAQGLQDTDGRLHIPQTGTAAQHHASAGENGSCQNGQHAVFRSLYGNFPLEAIPAPDQQSAHIIGPSR